MLFFVLTKGFIIGKTEYQIDTWSYSMGLSEGYIPSDVSNATTLAYPILDNGCVDAGFNYTAPSRPGRTGQGGHSGAERGMTVGAHVGAASVLVGTALLGLMRW